MTATTADLGLTRKQVHEARQVRDAELADPGDVRRTLGSRLKRGEVPTKATCSALRPRLFPAGSCPLLRRFNPRVERPSSLQGTTVVNR